MSWIFDYIKNFDWLNDKDSWCIINWKFYHLKWMLEEIEKSKPKLEILDIQSMFHSRRWNNLSAIDLVHHIRRVNNADMSIPIIINYDWNLLDWYHRVAKHIMLWKTKIRAYRIDLSKIPFILE